MDSRDYTPLTASMVQSTRDMQLIIRTSETALDVALFNQAEDNSLILRHFGLEPDADGSVLRHLEEIIYDNPLLLGDFARVDIIVDTPVFAVVPDRVADDADLCETILDQMFPDRDDSELVVNRLPDNASVVMAVRNDLAGFFRRAFGSPQFFCHLTPLIKFYGDRRRHGNTARMFANLRPGAVDIFVFGYHTLVLANTVPFRDTADAVYYILAVRDLLSINDDADELLVSGDSDLRKVVIADLRKFIPYVMPVIFPSAMFRVGRDALNAPFDLIVLPLCES